MPASQALVEPDGDHGRPAGRLPCGPCVGRHVEAHEDPGHPHAADGDAEELRGVNPRILIRQRGGAFPELAAGLQEFEPTRVRLRVGLGVVEQPEDVHLVLGQHHHGQHQHEGGHQDRLEREHPGDSEHSAHVHPRDDDQAHDDDHESAQEHVRFAAGVEHPDRDLTDRGQHGDHEHGVGRQCDHCRRDPCGTLAGAQHEQVAYGVPAHVAHRPGVDQDAEHRADREGRHHEDGVEAVQRDVPDHDDHGRVHDERAEVREGVLSGGDIPVGEEEAVRGACALARRPHDGGHHDHEDEGDDGGDRGRRPGVLHRGQMRHREETGHRKSPSRSARIRSPRGSSRVRANRM